MPPSPSPANQALLGPDHLVQGLAQLPSAATVLPRLLEVLNSSSSSLDDVVAVLRLDAGISARLLQVSNSAFYNRGVRCEALGEAVHKVGFLRVYELVSLTAASKLLLQSLSSYGMAPEELWRRSVTAAIAAEILAQRANLDPHVAYTVGLLHAVGLIAVDRWTKTQDPFPLIVSQGYPKETTANEIAVLGFTNASVGGALLRSWGFPDNLADPIRWQYDPRAASMRHHPMTCLLTVAKWLREAAHLQPGQPVPAEPDRWALQVLGVAPGDLEELAFVTRRTYEHVTRLLDDVQELAHGARADSAH